MNNYENIRKEREQFPGLRNSAYFETASTGLIPQYVYDGVKKYQDDRLYYGGDSTWGNDQIDSITMMGQAKHSIAEMINCKETEIVFAENTSAIMACYISNVKFCRGSNVVMAENVFSSGRYLWQMREQDGLTVRYAQVSHGKVTPEALFALVDEKTIAIHCDYVEGSTGYKTDAEKIGAFCKTRGIRFILDATQALGAIPVDAEAVQADLIAGNNYKWMLGYCGAGYGFIRRNIWKDIEQRTAGWMADENRFYGDSPHIILRDDGGRFELGYPNIPEIYGLLLVSRAYLRLGGQEIEKYLLHLREYLVEKVKDASGVELHYSFDRNEQSQIIFLSIYNTRRITQESLRGAGVMCNVYSEEAVDEVTIRIGLHYYNNEADIDKLFEAIETLR